MLRTRALAAAATILTTVALNQSEAGAIPPPEGADPASFAVSPASGPAGTTITLTGEDCLDDDGPGFVTTILARPDIANTQWFNFTIADTAPAANADGSWSITAKIPAQLENQYPGTVDIAPGTYMLIAFCNLGERNEDFHDWKYVDLNFEVTPSPEPPTTTATRPAGPTTPPPATPVSDEPPFTG